MIKLILGDCLEKMKDIPDGSVDSIVTDPPLSLDDRVCPAVARGTQTNKIREFISFFIITIKETIRSYMMNIYNFIFTTSFASIIIPFNCDPSLRLPITATLDYSFANIRRVIYSFSILVSTRTTAPFTCILLSFKLAFQKIKMITTIKASKYYFFFRKFFSNRNTLTDFTAIFTPAPFQSTGVDIKFFSTSFANSFHILIISDSGIICKR